MSTKWLAPKAQTLSSSTLANLHSILNRAVNRAMARDKVERNVAQVYAIPNGQAGRQSKSLSLDEAQALLAAADGARLDAYIMLSLLIGARTEELRPLRWDHVDLVGRPDLDPPVPPSVMDGPSRFAAMREALRSARHRKARGRRKVQDSDLVFATSRGTQLDAANVRRGFRNVIKAAGLDPVAWTPRELRHSFVSLMSNAGVSVDEIASLVGHAGMRVTRRSTSTICARSCSAAPKPWTGSSPRTTGERR